MTQATGSGVDKCCAAEALTRTAREAHLAVLAAFAETGRAPERGELDRIVRGRDADPDAVLAELAAGDLLAFDSDGQIRAAYPFSPALTAIRVTWARGPVSYAMCAIDALGMSAMLGRPVTITATEPGTGRLITVHVNGDQARWNPRRAVVFSGTTSEEGCPAADRTCGYINFFTGSQDARAWARANPSITGAVLGQGQALRHGIAEFGAFMRADTGDATRR